MNDASMLELAWTLDRSSAFDPHERKCEIKRRTWKLGPLIMCMYSISGEGSSTLVYLGVENTKLSFAF